MHSRIKSLELREGAEETRFPFLWCGAYACIRTLPGIRKGEREAACFANTSRQSSRHQQKQQQQQQKQCRDIMVVKVAINGFGRIGRCLFRFLWDMSDVGEREAKKSEPPQFDGGTNYTAAPAAAVSSHSGMVGLPLNREPTASPRVLASLASRLGV